MSEEIISGSNDEITSDDKLWATLCYIVGVIVPIIVLLMEDKKERPYIKYHAIQALATQVIFTVISLITLGCGSVVFLAELYLGYLAYQGTYFEIPVITDFIKNQGWV
ncbi:MAG: DUF4870 domain-containing protein [Anaerolineaceae bacterium]|nr:DUF4870 domain-containing protein [Anaerolineaceae bacterium]